MINHTAGLKWPEVISEDKLLVTCLNYFYTLNGYDGSNNTVYTARLKGPEVMQKMHYYYLASFTDMILMAMLGQLNKSYRQA